VSAWSASWLAVLVLLGPPLAGCLEDYNHDPPLTPHECLQVEVPKPRLGSSYIYKVSSLPIPHFGGIGGSVLDVAAATMVGSSDGIGEDTPPNDWPATHMLEVRFKAATRGGSLGGNPESYAVEYGLTSGSRRTTVHEEVVGSDGGGIATITYERTPSGEPYGKGGAFVRADFAGFPVAMGSALLWGKRLDADFAVEGATRGVAAKAVLEVSPPTLVTQGWPAAADSQFEAFVMSVGNLTLGLGCAAMVNVRNHGTGAANVFESPGTSIQYYASTSAMPLAINTGSGGGITARLIAWENGTGQALDGTPSTPTDDPRKVEPWEMAFRETPFGFPTMMQTALDASRENESISEWIEDASLAAFQHTYYPPSQERYVDRWDFVWRKRGEPSLHVNVTRQVPEPPLLPILPEDPEIVVRSHEGHFHADIDTNKGSAIGFSQMEQAMQLVAPDTRIEYVACDLQWRLCWFGSQYDEGWDGFDLVPDMTSAEWVAWHERFNSWGLAAHLDLGIVAQGRIPLEAG
jgi:hypothetical protein